MKRRTAILASAGLALVLLLSPLSAQAQPTRAQSAAGGSDTTAVREPAAVPAAVSEVCLWIAWQITKRLVKREADRLYQGGRRVVDESTELRQLRENEELAANRLLERVRQRDWSGTASRQSIESTVFMPQPTDAERYILMRNSPRTAADSARVLSCSQ
ncbi:MAG TPA: hypothetical protein VFT45_08840 [Longimicrobium sp.]|nr:hypothetical protein [Longimicrobium sp.]